MLRMVQMKLQARFSETQGTIDQLTAMMPQLEKAKVKLQSGIGDHWSSPPLAAVEKAEGTLEEEEVKMLGADLELS